MDHKSIRLAAVIVNRGTGNRTTLIFHTYNHKILLAVRGRGTASSTIMDRLGLDEPEKDLALGLSNKPDANRPLHAFGREVEFYKPGHGIAFILSPSGVSLAATDILSRHEDQTAPNSHIVERKEGISMTNSHFYELIASIIRTDLPAPIMEVVRKAGCQSSALVKVREIGADTGKKLLGMTLFQEKAILLVLTSADLKLPILKAICETIMKETGEHIMTISLSVDATEGLAG